VLLRTAVSLVRGAVPVLLLRRLLRRLPVLLLLRRSDGCAERVQSLGRSELKRCSALSVAGSLRRKPPLRLTLWRWSAPTLLLGRRLLLLPGLGVPRLRVRRRSRWAMMLGRSARRRLSPGGSRRRAVPALLRRRTGGGRGRLLDGGSAGKAELVGGLVLGSTASADDHCEKLRPRECPDRMVGQAGAA
jgi:hypothetical protein